MKEILFEWNPWWEEPYQFQKISRELFTHIKEWINRKEIIAIIGARRSGKTTLLFELIDHLINEQHVDRNNLFFIKADDDRVEKKDLISKALDEYLKWKNPQGKILFSSMRSMRYQSGRKLSNGYTI